MASIEQMREWITGLEDAIGEAEGAERDKVAQALIRALWQVSGLLEEVVDRLEELEGRADVTPQGG
jgi:predicted translin family RNA/ssDNA-binding protein